MLIKSIKFPKTKNNFFGTLELINDGYFSFCDNNIPYKFIVLIGKNGIGKTRLLRWLWYTRIRYIDNQQPNIDKCANNVDNFSNDMMIINTQENNFDYSLTISRSYFFSRLYPEGFYNKNLFCDNPSIHWFVNRNNYQYFSTFSRQKQVEDFTFSWEEKSYLIFNEEDFKKRLHKIMFPKFDPSRISDEIKSLHDFFRFWRKLPYIKSFIENIKNNCNIEIKIDDNGELQLIKEKNEINFSSLSSGEKHLITIYMELIPDPNQKKYKNLFLFIDEPENSLYPNQQRQLSSSIINLLKKTNKQSEIQIFIATHSPYILKNFLNRDDTTIIDVETGKSIKEDKKLLLNGNNNVSYDEISYLYYDVVTSNYYISLYEELKYKVDAESYKEVDNWLIMNKDKINEIIIEKKLDKNNFVEIEKIKCIKHGKLNNDGEIIEEKQLIVFYLGELGDGNYTDWDSFVEKFKDEEWRNSEKNQKIIGKLCNLLKCQSNEIYDRINGLDEETKKQAKKLFENKHHNTLWTTSTNLTRLRHMFAHAWKKEKNFLFYKKHPELFENNDETIAKTNNFYSIFKNENVTNEEIESLLKKYIELIREILIN